MKNIFILILCVTFGGLFKGNAQTIPQARLTNWSRAGLMDSVPSYSNVINIMNHGGINDGSASNHLVFTNACGVFGGNAGVVYFPPGTYLFNNPIYIPDSVVLRGAGDSTKLIFNIGGAPLNCINFSGTYPATNWPVTQPASKNDTTLTLGNVSGLAVGDWVMIFGDDTSLITSNWAYGTVGQIVQIESVSGNTIGIHQGLRRNYPADFDARLKRIVPRHNAGIECVYVERVDSTATQTYSISFWDAVNCWAIGVHSNKTNFAHIGITESAHILARGNYLHHSWGYGGGGRGYGVAVQYTSGDCLVENNIFEHLRHSILVQVGANGNVFGYNYSRDPYWDEPPLPNNSAGDLVLHGNYPYLNLFEGNVAQHIVVDNSHGINGPYNTFFRNRAQLYGIFMNSGTGASDSVNYVANEVTGTGPFQGNYSLAGTGHFEHGNNIKGTVAPTGTGNVPEQSLYLGAIPGFWLNLQAWPHIGGPFPYNQGNNAAQARYSLSNKSDCSRNPKFIFESVAETNRRFDFNVYPNPATDKVVFEIKGFNENSEIIITDIMGKTMAALQVAANSKPVEWNAERVPRGIYLYKIQQVSGAVATGRIVLQ